MPRTALYSGPKNTQALHYRLPLYRKLSHHHHGPFITQKAYEEISKKARIDRVKEEGVLLADERWLSPPFIFLRLLISNNAIAPMVFIAEEEMDALERRFEVPRDILHGSFFRKKEKRAIGSIISVKPSFSELLNPKWENAYLQWKAGMGRMPVPSRFYWRTFTPRHLPLPAERKLFHIKSGKKRNIERMLELSQINDERYVSYHFSQDHVSMFLVGPPELIGPKGPECVSWSPFNETKNKNKSYKNWTPYNRKSLLLLLGPRPSSTKYSFHKEATLYGTLVINLGNVDGTPFLIATQLDELPLSEEKDYFIHIFRNASSLKIELYSGAASKKPYAIGSVGLNEFGMPSRMRVLLKAPPKIYSQPRLIPSQDA